MPTILKFVLGLIALLAIVHNYLVRNPINGRMFIENAEGLREPAMNYEIEIGTQLFVVNRKGVWSIAIDRKIPGTVKATILNPEGMMVNRVNIPVPNPIISTIYENDYYLLQPKSESEFRLVSSNKESNLFSVDLVAAPNSSKKNSISRGGISNDSFLILLRRLKIEQTGLEKGAIARLYFLTYMNDELQELRPDAKENMDNQIFTESHTNLKIIHPLGYAKPQEKSKIRLVLYRIGSKNDILRYFNGDQKLGDFFLQLNPIRGNKQHFSLKSNELEGLGVNAEIDLELIRIFDLKKMRLQSSAF